MSESLYASASIVLFGREVDDLAVIKKGLSTATTFSKEDKQFARIYGFTYDGVYYEIPTPVLFMVKGKGKKASTIDLPGPNPKEAKFFASLLAWEVKQSEDTVRLDVDQGKFQDMLLSMLGDGVSGVSGARVSGARVSGARVSGARVSGARVSGARISGARGDASD
ncbi:pentapeptide repeat-containing protein [Roseobacter sp. YSTF-M11]|uniref:Pentapeptide repeat-containing protein n=1 Tax=Roseobacter insulae TaxID=2859783 RepID=A0A9X1FTS2_9RHOB|nr:pentapeptide repeat-containing protein [Roseobacter insulae]MBW4707381.1 pentapeptide repeat-containing protein [Roseobacter insulae]